MIVTARMCHPIKAKLDSFKFGITRNLAFIAKQVVSVSNANLMRITFVTLLSMLNQFSTSLSMFNAR
ncbi:hypothetical protein OPFLODJI_03057 [Aeromonas hydrophila]